MENLFTNLHASNMPLASKMRPQILKDFVGQKHIIGEGTALCKAIIVDRVTSSIFYGPPGTGKTTLAGIIANTCGGIFKSINAVTSGVADAKAIIEEAKKTFQMYGKKTYLLLDEIHRWNKSQSDLLLPALENGTIILIGSTTENPYISLTPAILSRCTVYEFLHLSDTDIKQALNMAIDRKEQWIGSSNIILGEAQMEQLIFLASGDVRSALNALEIAAVTAKKDKSGNIIISMEDISSCFNNKKMSLDKNMFYDMLSAFCKSLRGSDENSALYWAFRMIEGGVDEKTVVRRMIIHSSEDIGMADSNALLVATSALNSCEKIGPPECHMAIAHAIIYLCHAPKSNRVYEAMKAAKQAVREVKDDEVPYYLKNHPSNKFVLDGIEKEDKEIKGYKYPPNYGGWVEQQYLPKKLVGKVFYTPTDNGAEADLKTKWYKKSKI